MQIQGKVALVTGSAKRVGRIIALALAREGASLAVHYRRSAGEAGETVRSIRALGGRAQAFRADLSSAGQAAGLVRRAQAAFGRLDILVNSASLYERTPLETVSERQWSAHPDTNLKGVFFASREAARGMLRRKSGKIVNIIDCDTHQPYKREPRPFAARRSAHVPSHQDHLFLLRTPPA